MLLSALLALALQAPPDKVAPQPKETQEAAKPPAPPAAAEPRPVPAPPLSFFSEKFAFAWDKTLPLAVEVDGLKVTSIFFNRREAKTGLFKGAEFGTRAQLEVTNQASKPRTPGFAVAVFDAEGRLLGAASGGTKVGTVKPGETETFDLNFVQVKERLPLGATFVLSVELRD
ncbi:MAG: hypothetical protein IPL96_10200 [Holophagaceae bacterium]|nr:hypothetical protein [Holophagaceae bacterium]